MENSLIKDIGRSYIVSSFLPTALFSAVGLLIFKGFIPKLLSTRLVEQDVFYASQWFLFVIFTSWLAFGLYSGISSIIQLYEGYSWPSFISKPLKGMTASSLAIRKKNISAVLNIIDSKQSAKDLTLIELIEFGEKQEKARYEYMAIEGLAPLDNQSLLPTRLGNVLRASEIYSMEKYSIPGIMLWPRLLQLLPKELKEQIEEEFNKLTFTINSSLLSYSIGILSLSVGIIRLPCQIWRSITFCSQDKHLNFFERGFNNIAPSEYLIIGLLFLVVGYIAYCASIPVAQSFGSLIRTSYDLYRFELLRKLNHRLPKSIVEEKGFWQKLTEYMIAGDKLGFETPNIVYSLRKELIDYDKPKVKRRPIKRK